MAHVLKALVGETSTATPVGQVIVLAAAITEDGTTYQRFSAACSTNDTTEVMVRHATDGSWAHCLATYSAANELTLTTTVESSTGSAITWAAGDKTVVLTPLAGGLGRLNQLPSKTTPVDADSLSLWDSVGAVLSRVTWSNLKATLKTYFDGLYVTTGGALGTPSSGTLTSCTGLPAAGVTGTALTAAAAVTVGQGGTGRATGTTAYALVATGTTATGAQQSLAAGATTEVLVGGGASALPVWTTATGSGAPVRGTSPSIATPTLTTPTMVGTAIEDVFTITDGASVDIDPANGSIQLWTLTASRTPIAPTAFNAGQSVTLMILDGTAYTITWTSVAVTWVGGLAPALHATKYTVIELWKVGSVIYGATTGAA